MTDADKTSFRSLTADEIQALIQQGCSAHNWQDIEVAEDFKTSRIRNVHFSGNIKIGSQKKTVTLYGDIKRKTGIYNAAIHNCSIGNNVFICNVANYIANYDIEDNVIINHVSMLAVEENTSFGNGTEAVVINEMGGREIPIFDKLSSHVAYMIALYRHDDRLVNRLRNMIDNYVKSVTAARGLIQSDTRITNCGSIKNVKIGPAAVLEGVSLLENGTINSCTADPAYIGTNVIARDFILSSGCRVSDNVILSKCFIGQCTELAKHYSAENSVFFANCGGYHGEACSVFAGPYTVTHHKSTLLIAGLYSFLNAGSGSNQSNHMYKLGPVHQGIIERGSKTTSDSYILWPAKVGPFTLVMGRHYANSDTSDLPFSYIIEHEDESVCIPGVNIRSIGTVRDAKKWPQRDRRKDPNRLDHIIFDLLTPYTVQKMINGIEILEELKSASGRTSQHFYYNGVKIKSSSLEKGIKYYKLGIDRHLGNILVKHLRKNNFSNLKDLVKSLSTANPKAKHLNWVDIAGLLTTQQNIEQVLNDIKSNALDSIDKINDRFKDIHDQFESLEWAWVIGLIEDNAGKSISEFSAGDIVNIISNWIHAVETLDNMRCADAKKEFGETSRIGFGADGLLEHRNADFDAIRGSVETNDFITQLQTRLEAKKKTAVELIQKISRF